MVPSSSCIPYVPLHQFDSFAETLSLLPSTCQCVPSPHSSPTWLSPKRELRMNAHAFIVPTAVMPFHAAFLKGPYISVGL